MEALDRKNCVGIYRTICGLYAVKNLKFGGRHKRTLPRDKLVSDYDRVYYGSPIEKAICCRGKSGKHFTKRLHQLRGLPMLKSFA